MTGQYHHENTMRIFQHLIMYINYSYGLDVTLDTGKCMHNIHITIYQREWVIKFDSFSWTSDTKVHVIHISHVTITYRFESLFFLTERTCNLQVTINLRNKNKIENKHKKVGVPVMLTNHWKKDSGSVYIMNLKSLN